MILYKVTNLVNNKVYIGKTCLPKLNYRKVKHEHSVLCGSNVYFHNALRKYGFDNFKWEVLGHYDSNEDLINAEIGYIVYCQKYLKLLLYNLTIGGEGFNGYKHTDKTKELFRQQHLGKKFSQSHKDKISKSNIGKHDYWVGKLRSKLTKQKMSESQKKAWQKRKESGIC